MIGACLLLFCGLPIAGKSAGLDGSIDLEIADQRATLIAENADLNEILEQLAEKADFQLWISDRLAPRTLSLQIENQPLPVFLDRLLGQLSYALVLDSERKTVTGLFVLPAGNAPAEKIELQPGNYPDRSTVLRDALASPEIPDSIKLSMMAQFNAEGTEAKKIDMTRVEAISRLVEQIERNATADPDTIRRLRRDLERIREQQ